MTQLPKLQTAKQIAETFQVSVEMVRRLTREGRIPSVRISERKIRYVVHDVLNALNQLGNIARLEQPEVDPVASLFEE